MSAHGKYCVSMCGVRAERGYSYIHSQGSRAQQAALEYSRDFGQALPLTPCDSPCLGLACIESERGIGVNNSQTSEVPWSSETFYV